MNVQFCHKRIFENGYKYNDYSSTYGLIESPKGGETIALEVIEPWFFDTLTVNDFFEKRVGTARCSDEDNYCKKTGRELALSRMKPRRLLVKSMVGNEQEKIIVLVDKDENQFVLKKVNGHRVHFIEYHGKK